MAARSKDPRPTLTAYGAPLFFVAKRDMGLEEAVVRSLRVLRRDPTVLMSLPVVLVKNERALDGGELLAKAMPSTAPRYLTDARSSFARRAADEGTPPVVAD